jgi:tetratricopeptide (TPR) repeat protein
MQSELRYRKGDKIGNRYLVHKALAGGMGEVYLCLHLETKFPVALKTFQSRFLTSPKAREYFEREAATWVALEKHPNVVECMFMTQVETIPFLLLEWVVAEQGYGTDLRHWLCRHGALGSRLAMDLVIDVCHGLAHAAAKVRGFVHCDLKPENVLVAQGRLAKVTDFGLAKVVREAGLIPPANAANPTGRQLVTAAGGTPPYMAPEQWRGEAVDSRTDLYAVGCLLYELLTGHLIYDAESVKGLQQQHLAAPIPKLRLSPSDPLAGRLNEVLARCLAKEKTGRYATATDLLDELSEIYQARWDQPPRTVPEPGVFTATHYAHRGITYAELGLYEEALADYAEALRLDPNYALAYLNRGITFADYLGRRAEALADYSESLRIDPNRALAYFDRGNTYKALGRYQEALVDYGAALQIDPDHAHSYNMRGITYKALGRYEEALLDYGAALRLDPKLAEAFNNRGNTYAALSRHAEALMDFSRALQLDPNLAAVHANIGALHYHRGDLPAALASFEDAARLGYHTGARHAATIREELGLPAGHPPDDLQRLVEAFQRADSLETMRRAVEQLPQLLREDFITAVERTIRELARRDQPALRKRLAWLQLIARQKRRH